VNEDNNASFLRGDYGRGLYVHIEFVSQLVQNEASICVDSRPDRMNG
jgi:hypothetical protein